jgi:alpha-beta hydrolase superfamily lysophospholipase
VNPAVDTPDSSLIDAGVTRDGLSQLRRRWMPEERRAAVLLLHGMGEHSGRYLHVGAALAAAGFATVSYDQRGFGRSGGRRAFVERFSQFHDDVEDHLGQLRTLGGPVVLFGHSMGGLIALGYCLAPRPAPDLLVLSAPALASSAPAWMRLGARPLALVAPRLYLTSPIPVATLSRDVAVQEAYTADPLVEKGATALLGAELFAEMRLVSRHLHALAIPTLVIHGGDDRLVPPAASEPLAAVGGVERRVLAGLRHECMNEPEGSDVVAGIVAWLRDRLAVTAL